MRKFLSSKIEASVIDRARVIAAYKRVSLSDYLSDTLNPCIDRDFAEMVEEMGKAKSEPDGDPKPDGAGGPPPGRPTGPAARFNDPNIQPTGGPSAEDVSASGGATKKGRRRGDGLNGRL